MMPQLLLALCFAALIAAISCRTRLLTLDGAIAQFVMGFILLGIGGWGWTVPTLVFFLTSSLLSRAAARKAPGTLDYPAKSSTRDAAQVLANGGFVGAAAIGHRIAPDVAWYIAGLGSVAAANADTWGTELGTMGGWRTRLATTFVTVEPGRSGGISVPGTFGGAVGAALVACSALPWLPPGEWSLALPIACGGVAGSLVDSILGATVQAQYSCSCCGKITERPVHCGARGTRTRGIAWMGNDAVNLACTISGGLFALSLGPAVL